MLQIDFLFRSQCQILYGCRNVFSVLFQIYFPKLILCIAVSGICGTFQVEHCFSMSSATSVPSLYNRPIA